MKIKVKKLKSVNELGIETSGEIEMKKLDNGKIMNYGGKSLPF